jgi:hypothetical protein
VGAGPRRGARVPLRTPSDDPKVHSPPCRGDPACRSLQRADLPTGQAEGDSDRIAGVDNAQHLTLRSLESVLHQPGAGDQVDRGQRDAVDGDGVGRQLPKGRRSGSVIPEEEDLSTTAAVA